MKKSDAKIAVVRALEVWKLENDINSPAAPMLFYTWLQKEKSHLLDFRFKGDQYQVIAGWMNNPYGR